MTTTEFEAILSAGESTTVEFKSWIKASGMKERVKLAVDELIAFANTKGGTLFFGVEDDGTVTGCEKYDTQKLIESIYDKTSPPLFTEVEEIRYNQKNIIALSVKFDGVPYSTTDGRMLKRLGSSSKASYPAELGVRYASEQNPDFSAKIMSDSTMDDVNLLEIYNLKEKLKVRDPESTLIIEEDMAFLRDLGLIKNDDGVSGGELRAEVLANYFRHERLPDCTFLPENALYQRTYGTLPEGGVIIQQSHKRSQAARSFAA